MIKKVKNTVPWTNNLNGEEVVVHFTKTNCKTQIKKNLELTK